MPPRQSSSKIPPLEKVRGFNGQELDVDYYFAEEYADVADAARELPAVMEWLNELRSAYSEECDIARRELEEAEATAYFDLKGTGDGSFVANYQCKPTEEGMKMAIALDPKVGKLKDKIAQWKAMAARLTGTILALQAKIDLLRSSEATRRSTFDETSPRRD